MSVKPRVNYTRIGYKMRDRFGIERLTERYNEVRETDGMDPVEEDTVKRYCDSGAGYENGPPSHFKLFIGHLALCLWSD